jgi:hypothetical protein
MCKKTYNANMKNYLNGVTFRLDFFSLPDFKASYVPLIKADFPDSSFQERVLTDDESQIVNVDTLSYSLDLPLNDILKERVYVFDNIVKGGILYNIFVSPHYICIHADINNANFPDEPGDDVNEILGNFFSKIDLQKVFCMTSHFFSAKSEDEVWTVLDKEAYPKLILDDSYEGGNFIESISSSYSWIDLKRSVMKSDVDDGSTSFDFVVLTSAQSKCIDKDDMKGLYDHLYEDSIAEVAKCFK